MKNFNSKTSRAWAEIDLTALLANADVLRARLPSGCEIMAVVKADAYGHGAQTVAAHLSRYGVRAFAVATVAEGVALRQSGLLGKILVMSGTPPGDAPLLEEYNLTQLVADGYHARALDRTGRRLRVHIAIDTGMHRLGIEPPSLAEIESVYACENLTVEGMGTHLAVPDSLLPGDVEFTNKQCEKFTQLTDILRRKGFDTGKLHIQSSYGVLNYPGLKCDYARAGIALYGALDKQCLSAAAETVPVLSLRARVAQVRTIDAGESVSYGRTFTASRPMRIATVSIGYADGVPRQMSGGECLVLGRRAPVVGRICMDMLMLDVTEIGEVQPDDIVTLIGRDGGEAIACAEFAARCGTITHEVLSRLGPRLPRVYLAAD